MIRVWQLVQALEQIDLDQEVFVMYDGKMVPLVMVASHYSGAFLFDADGPNYIDSNLTIQLLVNPARDEPEPRWPSKEPAPDLIPQAPEEPPDRLETILWLDLPMADAVSRDKLKAAVAGVAADYCTQYGLTMTGTPIVTHQDQYGPMHNVMVRHRIRMYTEPYTSGYKLDSQTALDGDLPE